MFTKKIMERYAQVMLWALERARSNAGGTFHPGDIVAVNFDVAALKLAEAVYAALLSKGLNPIMMMRPTSGMEVNFYSLANEQQLLYRSPWANDLCRALNGDIYILAPDSITHLANTDPTKISRRGLIFKPGRKILDEREERGEYGWTLCSLPTAALAKAAGMSVREHGDEIIRACYLDHENPVAIWEHLAEQSQNIKSWLKQLDIESVRVESANTDLFVDIGKNRKWVGFSGCNMPGFEIFTSPDWRGTNGIYYADMPSYRLGRVVRGARLEFRRGEVVNATAEEGEELLCAQLKTDAGAKRLGEFSLTDKRMSPISRFMAETLFDENVGNPNGNCHVAIGDSYSDTYDGSEPLDDEKKSLLGFNDSSNHWDLVNTEHKRVTAQLKSGGKKVIYDDGIFLVD